MGLVWQCGHFKVPAARGVLTLLQNCEERMGGTEVCFCSLPRWRNWSPHSISPISANFPWDGRRGGSFFGTLDLESEQKTPLSKLRDSI